MGLTKDEIKAVAKQAIKEWLDDKLLAFGIWSLKTIACLALAALLYFILKMSGWSAVKETLTQ